MRLKKQAIWFFCIMISASCIGQSLTMNQNKYWDYRARLKKEFVKVGTGPGKSLVAESIDKKKSEVRFADATVYLGWYIATLATEYHLSSKNAYLRAGEGKEIEQEETLRELYYALETIDRLDLNAEPFFQKTAQKELNGFFMRDDVTKAFAKELNMKHCESDATSPNQFDNEESQDQVYHILLGIISVKNLIPAKTQVNGVFLRQKAIDQGVRIIMWMQKNKWHVVNAAIKKGKNKFKPVARGSQGYIFSQGLNRTLKSLTDQKMNFSGKVMILNKFFWGTLRLGINPTYASNDNRHMAMTVAALGNGWNRNSYRKLQKRARKDHWYAYPMLNRALYPNNRKFRKEKRDRMTEVLNMLSDAPAGGPVCPYPGRDENAWGSNHLFLKDYEYQKTGREWHKGKSFNGLDYMLLYNLYLINRSEIFNVQ